MLDLPDEKAQVSLWSACSFILGAAFPVRLSKVRGSTVCNSPINTYTMFSSITVCYSSENVTTAACPAASTVPSGPGGAAGRPSFLIVAEAEAMTCPGPSPLPLFFAKAGDTRTSEAEVRKYPLIEGWSGRTHSTKFGQDFIKSPVPRSCLDLMTGLHLISETWENREHGTNLGRA